MFYSFYHRGLIKSKDDLIVHWGLSWVRSNVLSWKLGRKLDVRAFHCVISNVIWLFFLLATHSPMESAPSLPEHLTEDQRREALWEMKHTT